MKPADRLVSTVLGLVLHVCATGNAWAEGISVAADGPLGYVQVGANDGVQSADVGYIAPWIALGTALGAHGFNYWDISLSRWHAKASSGYPSEDTTRVGLTPVFGWAFGESHRLFAEMGIGANVVAPRFRYGCKTFSTTFQFGDHVGLGYRFGAQASEAVSLRFEHFSNAGMREPNPGQNFIELRYAHGF
jgi:hypothetical protein